MTYDYRQKKTVIVIASELDAATASNVIAHLAFSIGNAVDNSEMGVSPLIDASGVPHRGISKFPIIAVTVKSSRLKKLVQDARAIDSILVADFVKQMLETGHDEELVAAIGKEKEEDMKYFGVALYGAYSEIHNLTGKFTLWGKQSFPA